MTNINLQCRNYFLWEVYSVYSLDDRDYWDEGRCPGLPLFEAVSYLIRGGVARANVDGKYLNSALCGLLKRVQIMDQQAAASFFNQAFLPQRVPRPADSLGR